MKSVALVVWKTRPAKFVAKGGNGNVITRKKGLDPPTD